MVDVLSRIRRGQIDKEVGGGGSRPLQLHPLQLLLLYAHPWLLAIVHLLLQKQVRPENLRVPLHQLHGVHR